MAERLLVVDDDDDFREEFKESLNEYEVIGVPNGDEALKVLRKPNEIDVVTLDVKMPGMNGLKVLKEIKRLSPDVSIIMITGFASKEVTLEALRGHADDFIEKPVDIEKTKEIIERLLDSKKGVVINGVEMRDKIEKVKRFTERNINKSVRLSDAAKAVCLSPKYLSRIFQQQTGVGFSAYRIKLCVEKAKTLLVETAFNVNQIAYSLGYQNAESFIRVFRSMTGYTPTEFREKNRKKRLLASAGKK